MSTELIAFDFFCGIGGLTRGLLNSGISVKGGFDIDGECRKTFEHNNSPAAFFEGDIRLIEHKFISEEISKVGSKNVLFTGCAPCQSFSKQRRSNVRRPDATVLGAFADLVRIHQPGFVVIENVPGLSKVKGFSIYRRFKSMLKEHGYLYEERVIDAKYFGVPQTRKRLILVASRTAPPSVPPYSHGKGLADLVTVRDAIGHYPPINAGESHPTVSNHCAAAISELNLRRLEATQIDGGDRLTWPKELWLDCHKGKHKGHTDVYGRMFWDRPAPTLTGKCVSISNGRYGHPEQHRALTPREAASIQSFDDDFVFFGNLRKTAQHIGNAVPSRLGEVIGRHILKLHKIASSPVLETSAKLILESENPKPSERRETKQSYASSH